MNINIFKQSAAVKELNDAAEQLGGNTTRLLTALRNAAEQRSPFAVPPMIRVLKLHSRSTVRTAAAEALGKCCTAASIEVLINFKEDRYAADSALKNLRDNSDTDELIAAFREGNEVVRAFAVSALGNRDDKRVLPSLIKAAADSCEAVRLAAIASLGTSTSLQVADVMMSALKDSSPKIRSLAVANVAKYPMQRAREALWEHLKDEVTIVRASAAEALRSLQDGSSADAFIAALKDTSADVRCIAVGALADLRPTNVIGLLIPMLNDGVLKVRIAAAESLGILKDARAVFPLIAATEDGTETLAVAVAQALAKLNGLVASEKLVSAAVAAARHIQPPIARWIVEELKASKEFASLAALLVGHGPVLAYAAKAALIELRDPKVVDPLRNLLAYADQEARLDIVQILHDLKVSPALELLIDLLSDPEENLRVACIQALAAVGGPRAEMAILTVNDNRLPVRLACIKSLKEDEGAINFLIVCLGDDRREVRTAAVEAMAVLELSETVEPLIIALADESKGIQFSAATALSKSNDLRAVAALNAYKGKTAQPAMLSEITTGNQHILSDTEMHFLDYEIQIIEGLINRSHNELEYNLALVLKNKANLLKASENFQAAIALLDRAVTLLAEQLPLSCDLADIYLAKAECLGAMGNLAETVAMFRAAAAIKSKLSHWDELDELENEVELYTQIMRMTGRLEFSVQLARAQVRQAVTLFKVGSISCPKCGGRGRINGGTLSNGRHYDLPCSPCRNLGFINLRPSASAILDCAIATYDRLANEGRSDLLWEMREAQTLRARQGKTEPCRT